MVYFSIIQKEMGGLTASDLYMLMLLVYTDYCKSSSLTCLATWIPRL